MRIREFVWAEDRIDDISRQVSGRRKLNRHALVGRWSSEQSPRAENPVYYVLGQTDAGRYLFAVVIRFPDGKGYTVTARPMTDKEERQYRRWKER